MIFKWDYSNNGRHIADALSKSWSRSFADDGALPI